MSTGLTPDPSAPGGSPTSPVSGSSFLGQFTVGHVSLIGFFLNTLVLVILLIAGRGCIGGDAPPAASKAAAPKRIDDVTLGEARELAEELGKVSDSLAPFLDARLKPLKEQLTTQGKMLDEVAKKVLDPE